MSLVVALARHWRMALIAMLAAILAGQGWRITQVKAELATRDAALASARLQLAASQEAVRARDRIIQRSAQTEQEDAAEMAAQMKGSCRAAFDAGYAARRCAPGEPGGVRDLQDLWLAGAFPRSAPVVPGEPIG